MASLGYKINSAVRLDMIAGYRENESDFLTNQEEMPIVLATQYNLVHHERESSRRASPGPPSPTAGLDHGRLPVR